MASLDCGHLCMDRALGASVCRELLLLVHLLLVLWGVSNCICPVRQPCGRLCPRRAVVWCLAGLGGVYLRTYLLQE